MDQAWGEVVRQNDAFGEQVKEIKNEQREVEVDQIKATVGGKGLLKDVTVMRKVMGIETRAVVTRKRGGEPECSGWTTTGSTVTRTVELAFDQLNDLKVIQ